MVELMVVIAVIALLVAILMPALSMARSKAKYTQAKAQFNAFQAGIEAFRGESALGARIPPSASDDPDDHQLIADPNDDGTPDSPNMRIAGAHLLFQAMLGADLLGTPGFVDTDRNGFWSDDTYRGKGGAYELDTSTTLPMRPRYGGAGYVDDKMKARAKSLAQLQEEGSIVMMDGIAEDTAAQLLFLDPWDHPILYYRANPAARWMMGEDIDTRGIYRQEDNGIITGSTAEGYANKGIDFGAGANPRGYYHNICVAVYPNPVPVFAAGANDLLTLPAYDDSLARFILDPSVTVRNTPVRKDSYLLISAGEDGRYGTSDDVINWTSKTE